MDIAVSDYEGLTGSMVKVDLGLQEIRSTVDCLLDGLRALHAILVALDERDRRLSRMRRLYRARRRYW